MKTREELEKQIEMLQADLAILGRGDGEPLGWYEKIGELGDLVRDSIRGYWGVAQAHAKHLTGCDRIHIAPLHNGKPDGKIEYGYDFDITSVQVLQKGYAKLSTHDNPKQEPAKNGGPPTPRERL